MEDIWRPSPSHLFLVPDTDADLLLRLCITAHTSATGYCGRLSTEQELSPAFSWSFLSNDVCLFVSSCIHCISTKKGEMIPRPHSPALHGTEPNDLLQFYNIELGLGSTGDNYILMLCDDRSGYSWLYPPEIISAETAAHAILDWCAAFGSPN